MFNLVTRCAGESSPKYAKRLFAKFADLNDLYPDAAREYSIDGKSVFLIFGGQQVAYLAYPEEKKKKIKRWADE